MNFNIGEAEENRVRSSLRTRPDLFQNGTRCSCDPTSILKVVFGRGSAALGPCFWVRAENDMLRFSSEQLFPGLSDYLSVVFRKAVLKQSRNDLQTSYERSCVKPLRQVPCCEQTR